MIKTMKNKKTFQVKKIITMSEQYVSFVPGTLKKVFYKKEFIIFIVMTL